MPNADHEQRVRVLACGTLRSEHGNAFDYSPMQQGVVIGERNRSYAVREHRAHDLLAESAGPEQNYSTRPSELVEAPNSLTSNCTRVPLE